MRKKNVDFSTRSLAFNSYTGYHPVLGKRYGWQCWGHRGRHSGEGGGIGLGLCVLYRSGKSLRSPIVGLVASPQKTPCGCQRATGYTSSCSGTALGLKTILVETIILCIWLLLPLYKLLV